MFGDFDAIFDCYRSRARHKERLLLQIGEAKGSAFQAGQFFVIVHTLYSGVEW